MTNDSNEVIEVAKATQEVAKTSSKALDVTEKFCRYISKFVGGPLEQAVGIFEDKLKYIRWERQQRLFDRAQQFIENERSTITRPLSIKHAIPLLSAASLEDDDYLQDIWARLLVNFTIESSSVEPARTYIDILERLSSLEVKIISAIYIHDFDSMHHNRIATRELPKKALVLPEKPDKETIKATEILPSNDVMLALSNLDRLGIVHINRSIGGGHLFGTLNPTLLGKAFYEACTLNSEK